MAITVGHLRRALSDIADDAPLRLAEYNEETGHTERRFLNVACNTEHQREIGQLWLTRGHVAEAD
ncbi:hypothetical protein KAR91_08570 [Candidatus Pacearchaeota archaeon]|nr:hypothetical protein [Candidatus Pacearchaeota archaeon]